MTEKHQITIEQGGVKITFELLGDPMGWPNIDAMNEAMESARLAVLGAWYPGAVEEKE